MVKHFKIFVIASLATLLFLFVISSSNVFAADAGLVPCGPGTGKSCTTCDFFQLINNIVNFVTLKVAPALAITMIVVGAFFLITASGSETAVKKGKDIITMAIVGFLVIISSWFIIDVILAKLAPGNTSGSWYKIECVSPSVEVAPTSAEILPAPPITGGPEVLTAEDARDELKKNGISINHDNECPPGQTKGCTSLAGIRQTTILGVENIKKNCNCNVTITGGTEGGHAGGAISHGAGYKVDLGFNPGINKYVHDQIGISNPPIDGTWKGRDGNIYHYEVDHWDVVVKH